MELWAIDDEDANKNNKNSSSSNNNGEEDNSPRPASATPIDDGQMSLTTNQQVLVRICGRQIIFSVKIPNE
jgi:hypothetical protein